jgi:hypothetical protein
VRFWLNDNFHKSLKSSKLINLDNTDKGLKFRILAILDKMAVSSKSEIPTNHSLLDSINDRLITYRGVTGNGQTAFDINGMLYEVPFLVFVFPYSQYKLCFIITGK